VLVLVACVQPRTALAGPPATNSSAPVGAAAATGGRARGPAAERLQTQASTQAIQRVTEWAGAPAVGGVATTAAQKTPAATSIQSAASIANAKVHNGAQDMQPLAGHHYGKSHGGGHGKYYMYAESPKKGSYKAGFKRGNHKHMIERKEYQHKSHAGGYMKWHSKKGKGSHKWEFKHHDKKGKGHHY